MRNTQSVLPLALLALTACTAPTDATSSSALKTAAAGTNAIAAVTCDATALPFGGGNGSVDSPNLICSAAQFQNLGVSPYNGQYALLAADLGIQSVTSIATFSGTLDGAGHMIAGFAATTGGSPAGCGLISALYGTLKNIEVRMMTVNCPSYATGGVVAVVEATGVIDNVVIHDSTIVGNGGAGALAGQVYGSVTRSYSWTNSVTGAFGIGGLVGQVNVGGTVTGNSSSGSYSSPNEKGFVVGINGGTLECLPLAGHAFATVHATGYNSGTTGSCPN